MTDSANVVTAGGPSRETSAGVQAAPPGSPVPIGRLIGTRRAVRAILWLGIAVSLVANMLHAPDTITGRCVAAWPPLALFLAVELVSRIKSAGWLGRVRLVAAGSLAAIAGWISYTHMLGVAEANGERGMNAHLVPLTVDGLIVIASVCLVELGRQIRSAEATGTPTGTAPEPRPEVVPPVPVPSVPVPEPLPVEVLTSGSLPEAPMSPAPAGSGRGRSAAEWVALADAVSAEQPELTKSEVAELIGCSDRHLRNCRKSIAEG